MKPKSDCQGVLDLVRRAGGEFHVCSLDDGSKMISVVKADIPEESLMSMPEVKRVCKMEVVLPRNQGE
jgi:hypothetical protein